MREIESFVFLPRLDIDNTAARPGPLWLSAKTGWCIALINQRGVNLPDRAHDEIHDQAFLLRASDTKRTPSIC
jgi:hypothetical protein